MIALVPGVSTMAISRKNSLGYPFSRTPSLRSLDRVFGVAQNGDAVRRRRDALLGDIRAEQSVYERRLARVELSNDDEQEQFLEVGERPPDEFRILRRRAEILQERDQTLQKPTLPLHQCLAALVEDPHALTLPLHASIIYARGFHEGTLVVRRRGTIRQAVYMEAA